MLPRPYRISLALALACAAALPASGQTADTRFSAADINAAQYQGGDLPSGRTALTAKVQVLLDRSGISPGVVDGFSGGMSQSAITAFERRAGLPMDGRMDPQVWQLLQPYAATPETMEYLITDADAEGLVDAIPSDYAEKAQMTTQGYTSIGEKLGERFHMDDKFIAFLNPGVPLQPGSTIQVTVPAKPIKTKVTRILIDKAMRRVAAYDAHGEMIVDYPATVGSNDTPSPAGHHRVVTVALNPNYTYNPSKNFRQGQNDKALIIPPGPNGPVGSVWIDLSQPTYGIHGTATPSRLFHNQSHGCVRLTNWDAEELAHMVSPGVTTVEFLEPGITIADMTGGAVGPAETAAEVASTAARATISARAPLARPARPGQPLPTAAPSTAPMATIPGTTLPDQPVGALPQATQSIPQATQPLPPATEGAGVFHEDTTEDAADRLAPADGPNPVADLLSDALSGALPEGDVVTPGPDLQP